MNEADAKCFAAARKVVEEQARDFRLWEQAAHTTEAMLQNELRRLHAAIEGVKPDELARDFTESLLTLDKVTCPSPPKWREMYNP
jgi:hypothetical protein